MAVRPPTPEERERIVSLTDALLAVQAAPMPLPLNGDVLAFMVQERTVPIRRRVYRVPQISVVDGGELYEVAVRLDRARYDEGRDPLEVSNEITALYLRAVEIIRRVLRPVGWRRLLPRRWSAPPADLTESEVGWLIGFLFVCRATQSPAGREAALAR